MLPEEIVTATAAGAPSRGHADDFIIGQPKDYAAAADPDPEAGDYDDLVSIQWHPIRRLLHTLLDHRSFLLLEYSLFSFISRTCHRSVDGDCSHDADCIGRVNQSVLFGFMSIPLFFAIVYVMMLKCSTRGLDITYATFGYVLCSIGFKRSIRYRLMISMFGLVVAFAGSVAVYFMFFKHNHYLDAAPLLWDVLFMAFAVMQLIPFESRFTRFSEDDRHRIGHIRMKFTWIPKSSDRIILNIQDAMLQYKAADTEAERARVMCTLFPGADEKHGLLYSILHRNYTNRRFGEHS
mmetsp:Transcript_23153/g.65329  ORF Transcript_23153/g.65329 Transcript_23153/m.65329 type:complete len:293 (+) Transcript_23153:68-946(+)